MPRDDICDVLGSFAVRTKIVEIYANMTAYANAAFYVSSVLDTILLNSVVPNRSLVPRPEEYIVAGLQTVKKYRMTCMP
jgi:hypothetical protein